MILTIGEILFDIFPAYKRLGGAPFNVAAHLKALGFSVVFASRVGDDPDGKRVLNVLSEKGFDLRFVQVDPDHETGHVNVVLDDQGSPAFEIIRDVAYDYLAWTDEIDTVLRQKELKLICYGTLMQRTPEGAETVQRILENRPPDARCFYDINLRPGCYHREVIATSLTHCDILKLSDEELTVLRDMFGVSGPDDEAVRSLMDRFGIQRVSLTGGKAGSRLYTPETVYAVGVEKNIQVVDTVGAGDAYAAMMATGYLLGWKPEQMLKRANTFAGAICEVKGAIPDDDHFYDPFLRWLKGEQE